MNSPRYLRLCWLSLLSLTITIITTIASNQVAAHEHHDQLHAHVHGHAELMLTIDNQTVLVNVIAPAESLVGFEHQATSQLEKQQVAKTEAILAKSDHVIKLNGGNCTLEEVELDTSAIYPIEDEHHAHEHETHKGHSEISASYLFNCESPSKIKSSAVTLFKHFYALEQVRAVWIGPSNQGSKLLVASSPIFELN